jgi:hypothetical protein
MPKSISSCELTAESSQDCEIPPNVECPARRNTPSAWEVTALVVVSFALFIAVVTITSHYFKLVDNFGDSSAYMGVASAIRHWDFRDIPIKQFWGLPYGMAALSKLTGFSDRQALLCLSFLPSLLAAVLAWRLWDGWVASYFSILNFDWLQRSCLGGSEPLFICLLFGSFLSVRRGRWLLASLLASLATVVRPLGVFALIGIGLALLWKHDFRRLAGAICIGLAIGVLYSIPLASHFGDPLATVNSYQNKQWQGGWLFGFPFLAIVKGTILHPAPWTNLVLSFGWIFLVLTAVVMMIKSREFRNYCRTHTVEAVFLFPYLWCLFTYNYPHWARGSFARFAIPVLPFVLLAWLRWIPKDRRILWGAGVVCSILAATSALGVVNVIHMIRQAVR